MEDQIKVSVVIPVYDAAEFIGECLESIIGQSLQGIEIICVDDGSSDDSPNILESYASKDKRVIILSQENGGPSVARNAGLDKARGKYVYFMDSDDVLELNALEELFYFAEANDLDVAFLSSEAFRDGEVSAEYFERMRRYLIREHEYPSSCTGPHMHALLTKNEEYIPVPWGQLIRRSFLQENDIRFIPGIKHEDEGFVYETVMRARRAGLLTARLHRYRIRENSESSGHATFEKSYGCYRCYVDMRGVLDELASTLSDEDYFYASMRIHRLLESARRNYAEAPDAREEQDGIREREKQEFEMLVADPARLMSDTRILSRTVDELAEQVRGMEKSASWKVGSALVRIPGKVKRSLRRDVTK